MANKLACIYQIRRIDTGDLYVGSTFDYRKRVTSHKRGLNGGLHHASRLQNSWSKYGPDAFVFEIIEVVTCTIDDAKSILVEREQHWIDALNPCYNTVQAAGSTLGFKMPRDIVERHREMMIGRRVSQEEAERLRTLALGAKRSDETKERLREHGKRRGIPALAVKNSADKRRGKRLSAEHVEKMRVNSTGRKHSEDTLQKMRDSNTPDVREKKGAASRGKRQSPEHAEKRRLALIAYHERRRTQEQEVR